MEVDKLLIIAHPDDEVLWGGMNLILQSGWFVICSTHLNDPVRSVEFFKTMSWSNVTKYIMFDVKDEYTEDPDEAEKLYRGSTFEKALKEFSKHSWKLVLTHNEIGEYGHEHHRMVHTLVKENFKQSKFFKVGEHLSTLYTDLKRELLFFYKATQSICKKIYNKKGNTLKVSEREHFFNETLYVPLNRKVSNIIHQIWFGNPLDKTSVRYNLMNGVQNVAERNDIVYKLWTNNDLKEENFPLTFHYIQKAIEIGKELEQSRFAQVADLARYEILHRFGGIYLDSLFEISDEFCKYIQKHSNFELIVANEDPCGLKCKGGPGHYVSNGFFACIPGCINLKRLLHPASLNDIDFYNVRINQETGPYFFRKGIRTRDKVHVIDTDKIYPFMVNDSEYRPGEINQCISEDDKLIHDCLKKKYPKSLAVYQSGFGGSWSW